jgi:membrane fusion protein (multidrug efflux system)
MVPLIRVGRISVVFSVALAGAVAGGCLKKPAASAPPAEVQVIPVEQRDVPVVRDWIGSLDSLVNAQIRAQVSGYLVKQDYREGTFVHQGDPLFEIDPRPFEAALAQANGQLAQAKAQQGKASEDVTRYTPLARDKAISEEELDDAVQSKLAAEAQVASAQASVEVARLNLGFTHIVSPTDGIAGLIQTQIGNLVGPGSGILTTVASVDPIKAYFPISEQAYLEFRRQQPDGPALPPGVAFELILSDGSVYPRKGTFFALDNQIDANTGTLRVAAVFPNPSGLLRPGQYARVRAVIAVEKGALVVPQRAVSELQGGFQVATVDAENRAHIVTVTTGERIGAQVVVLQGLHPGDRVVADGVQKIVEGAAVNPIPYSAEAGK